MFKGVNRIPLWANYLHYFLKNIDPMKYVPFIIKYIICFIYFNDINI